MEEPKWSGDSKDTKVGGSIVKMFVKNVSRILVGLGRGTVDGV